MAEPRDPDTPHGGGVDSELNYKWIFGFVIGLLVRLAIAFALVWGVSACRRGASCARTRPLRSSPRRA